jgi:hypothetical protein
VITGNDGRPAEPLITTLNERSIIPENIKTLSFTASEKMEKQFLNSSTPYLWHAKFTIPVVSQTIN